jgi:hypothetical protein
MECRDENLPLQGYPMLTEFNMDVIYMLYNLFDAVYFMTPTKQDVVVLFIGFRKRNPVMRRFLDKVYTYDSSDKLHNKGGNQTVLSLFPINKLYERYSSPGTRRGGRY